jgi:hypothetical protein
MDVSSLATVLALSDHVTTFILLPLALVIVFGERLFQILPIAMVPKCISSVRSLLDKNAVATVITEKDRYKAPLKFS